MPGKSELLVLPENMPRLINPAEGLYRQHCNPSGFEFPTRIRATEQVHAILDRYKPLGLPDWWRDTTQKPPVIGERAIYFRRLNAFFEEPFAVNKDVELFRTGHETAHAVTFFLSPSLDKYNITFVEGLADWLACEVIERSRIARGFANWHEKAMAWKDEGKARALQSADYTYSVRLQHARYLHGHKAVYEVMSALFNQQINVLDQLQFILANYDPTIIGDRSDREMYIDYAKVVMGVDPEQKLAIA